MLDDPERMAELDPDGMRTLVADFVAQFDQAVAAPLPALGALAGRTWKSVAFLGMGGSGAGGEYARTLLDESGGPPSVVVHDYVPPRWIGPDTLVVATSYSGNTEETLAALADTRAAGAPWVAVTSGGDLAKAAKAHDAPLLTIPGGFPPRAAFGHLTIGTLRLLAAAGVVDEAALNGSFSRARQHLVRLAETCGLEQPTAQNPAKQMAEALDARTPVLVADDPFAAVAERIRCQLNENSKVLAFTRILPESNHNDTVAWTADSAVQDWAALFVGPFARLGPIAERARFVREVMEDRGVPVHTLDVDEDDLLARRLAVTYLGDWVSLYLAFQNGEDPNAIAAIPKLKDRCAKTGLVGEVRTRLGI